MLSSSLRYEGIAKVKASLFSESYNSATADWLANQVKPAEEVVDTFTYGGAVFDLGQQVEPEL